MDEPSKKYVIHWFRKGLRLHDNPALCEAFKGASTFRCVYILDPWFAGVSQVGINKWSTVEPVLKDHPFCQKIMFSQDRWSLVTVLLRVTYLWTSLASILINCKQPLIGYMMGLNNRFLLQCLEDLDSSLRKVNSRLFVIRGQPTDVFPRLFKEWHITTLSFEEDPEPFGKERDAAISAMAKEAGVEVIVRMSHTLFNLQKIITENNGTPPLTFKRFQSILKTIGPPTKPVETVTLTTIETARTPIENDHDDRYGVPSLEELGFDVDGLKPSLFHGGETEALLRLDRHLERKAWVASFEKPKMTSQSLLPSQTTISPYLKFGCLSPRLFYWKLNDLYRRVKKKSDPPLSLHGQLLWREFFYLAATNNPKFDRMVGNPICVQVPWDKNKEALAKWAEGKTGFPWIDAIMIQLREVGWIHHLARHSVACFLTRGDLWISWEEGMKVFDELLLDADWSVNAGMWLWLSCSSFFQQFLNCYCPVGFGKRADPTGDFIRHYIPQLKGFHPKYIYEPWTAPHEVQVAAKCIIGKDYPQPMVDHNEVSRQNMERMKQVYQILAMRASGVSVITKTLTDDTVSKHPHSRISYATSCSNHISGNKPSKAAILLGGDSMSKLSHNSDEDNTGNSTNCDQI